MKKILAGYLYRLFRGFEIWVLLALLLISTIYMNFVSFRSEDYIATNLTGNDLTEELWGYGENTLVHINASEVNQYRFDGLNVSAYDVYRMEADVLPEATRDILCRRDKVCFAGQEAAFIVGSIKDCSIMPIILIVLFIPIFFGRLFSDGVIKNYIADGFRKRTIYLASLLFTCILNLLLLAISTGVFVIFCLIYKWHPPVYLPMLLFILLIDFLMALTVSSLLLAVLFAARKKTAAIIAGFLVVISMFFIPFSPAFMILVSNETDYDNFFQSETYEELKPVMAKYGLYAFETKFDVTAYTERLYYNGKECFPMEYDLPKPVEKTLITMIYLDHAMIKRSTGWRDFPLYRDGVYAINAACNVFWTILFNAAGIMIFKKRELN